MSLPSGTVTFLFTDIERSIALWESYPESMRAALARHDDLVRRAIVENRGIVFKTIGDAFCGVFACAPDALDAALASQLALMNEPWPTDAVIKARMAIHTGTAECRDDDYFGPPVNRVARLLAVGHGGQILLSNASRSLCQPSLPPECALRSLGEHRLKDLSVPEVVFQLIHPELPGDFPALRSLGNPQLLNNLPQQMTSFIGREREIAEIGSILRSSRLLTLVGTGGCGKTRLSLQIAAELLDGDGDGVWLVELAALADSDLVPQAVADVFKLQGEPGKDATAGLAEHLADRRLLIVLDNCEHVLSACATLVDALLKACPQVSVLATSRERLGMEGEATYRVPSLSLPDPKRDVTPESLVMSEATRLFVERVRLHSASFAVNSQNAPALASVCYRLDGIPLAIELAAARLRSMSLEEVNRRLDQRFRLLTTGSRTALPRQQTLRSLIDWSYDLLDDGEKVLLGRLSVFAGGCTVQTAEQVCGEKQTTLSHLLALADKSLVICDDVSDETRFRMLETVRQYAHERLAEEGEEDRWRDAHLRCFTDLCETAEPHLDGAEQQIWLERLDREHDNLRSALAWSCEGAGDPALGVRLGGALWWYWYVRGYFGEGRHWLNLALSRTQGERSAARRKALNGAGALAYHQGDYQAAREFHEESLAACRELGDPSGMAASLGNLGILAYGQGDYDSAGRLFEECMTIKRDLGDQVSVASLLCNLGLVALGKGDHDAAWALFQQGVAIRRDLGDRRGVGGALCLLGSAAQARRDYPSARCFFEEGLAIHREFADTPGVAAALHDLAALCIEIGERGEAEALLEECLSLNRDLGDLLGIATALNLLADLAIARGDYPLARKQIQESLTTTRRLGMATGIADALESLADVLLAEGVDQDAARLLGVVERVWADSGVRRFPAQQSRFEARLAAVRPRVGDTFDAMTLLGQAMTMDQAIAFAVATLTKPSTHVAQVTPVRS